MDLQYVRKKGRDVLAVLSAVFTPGVGMGEGDGGGWGQIGWVRAE